MSEECRGKNCRSFVPVFRDCRGLAYSGRAFWEARQFCALRSGLDGCAQVALWALPAPAEAEPEDESANTLPANAASGNKAMQIARLSRLVFFLLASSMLRRVETCLLLPFLVVLPQACHVCKPRLPMTQPMTRGK
ncbi:hypothetical protein A249_37572 [Pseudomonas syringae pv. actinidiae ICMP 18804]|uniref:Uncharacterized protein n=1 Tax=Pseudomonas syringae pv. actinidiae ICMP 19096 TaxID=1194405 RepID=A0A656K4P0_PSESF|nr:hypothetical protein A249_37572 [Pseudomonas syringae pv. actinidiae ICMP 18804]EPN69486.1 hypothetical protein A245_01746 [Pseudomonas syringae pv. actinidiae ICMP 19096]